MQPRLTSNRLYSQGIPWTSHLSASTFGVLVSASLPSLCLSENWIQDILHGGQVLYPLSYILSPINSLQRPNHLPPFKCFLFSIPPDWNQVFTQVSVSNIYHTQSTSVMLGDPSVSRKKTPVWFCTLLLTTLICNTNSGFPHFCDIYFHEIISSETNFGFAARECGWAQTIEKRKMKKYLSWSSHVKTTPHLWQAGFISRPQLPLHNTVDVR